jgi:hypothetical protein
MCNSCMQAIRNLNLWYCGIWQVRLDCATSDSLAVRVSVNFCRTKSFLHLLGKSAAVACKHFQIRTCGTMESTTIVQIRIPDHYGACCLLALGLLRYVADQKMFEWAKRQQMHASSNSIT